MTKCVIFFKIQFSGMSNRRTSKQKLFLESRAKLDKVGMLQNENFVFEDLTLFDLTLT